MATGDQLLEAVRADTIANEIKRASRNSLAVGTPCPNCHTALAGPWCYECGQRGEEYHRSIWRLTAEAFMGLADLDGRIWQTFPRIILRPGKLTRDYLDGHRAVQVPPFRIFLIVVLLVFFTGGLNISAIRQNIKIATLDSPQIQKALTTSDRADLKQATDAIREKMSLPKVGDTRIEAWMRSQLAKALGNQDAFKAVLAEWAQRFAILMLPIAAIMLTVLFPFKKGVYVFDHLIFSMHSLSFQGLLLSAVFVLGMAVSWADALLWLAPVHLFVHLRGTYRISAIGALIRMFLLFIGSSIAFAFLAMSLVVVGLATVR